MLRKVICHCGTGGRTKTHGAGTVRNRFMNGSLASVPLHLFNIDLRLPQIIGIPADSTTRHAGGITHLTDARLFTGFDVIAVTAINRV